VAESNALAQLKDIHLPETVDWWPLAPGWYGLLLIIIIATIGLIHFFYKRHVNALPKKQALALLRTYVEHYEREHNTQITSSRISQLLRRVALVYYPRTQVASIHGEAWIEFLNQTAKNVDFRPVQSLLLESPFKTSEAIALQPLISQAESWIKQRKKPCLN
jgi:hypothetical protein